MISLGQILWKIVLKKTWYLHKLETWAYAWIMWIIWNWLLISGGLSICLCVNLLCIHPMSMFSNWWQWTIEVCSYGFTLLIACCRLQNWCQKFTALFHSTCAYKYVKKITVMGDVIQKPFQGQFLTKRFSIHKEKETFVPWLNSMPRHLVLFLELSFYNNSELERLIATQMKLGNIMKIKSDLT
jgi:hypothetical protein